MVENSIIRNLCLCGIYPNYTENRDLLVSYLLRIEYKEDIQKIKLLEEYFDFRKKKYTEKFFTDVNFDVFMYFLYYYSKHRLTFNLLKIPVVSYICGLQIVYILSMYDLPASLLTKKNKELIICLEKKERRKFLKLISLIDIKYT